MYDLLTNLNQGLKKSMISFAQKLVSTPSNSLHESMVARLVEDEMKELGYDEVFRDDAGNVIGMLYGFEGKQTVLLNSHMDSVAVDDINAWTRDPYAAVVEKGRLYGVGAADCKSGLAAQVYAGALLKRSNLPLKDNVVVAATVAEENGAGIGIQKLMDKTLKELEIKPDWAILGEPTSLDLYYGHDGWMEMEIKAAGTNIFKVDDAMQALVNEFNSYTKQLNDDYGQEIQRVYHPVNQETKDREGAGNSMRLMRRLSMAEKYTSIVNEHEHIAADAIRSMGDVAVAVGVKKEKQKLYNGTTTIVRRVVNAWEVDPFCSLITRARQCLAGADCKTKPGKWKLNRLGMGTAGSLLVNKYNVSTIGYGPGEEEMAHAVNESVQVKKITEASYGTAVIAYGLVGVPVFGWTSDEI